MTRSGFVALAGRPNAGKSTLLNRLVGGHVAIVSDKPQTTRRAIRGIATAEDWQAVLVDLPGMQKPRDKLTERMQKRVERELAGSDVALFMLNGEQEIGPGDEFIARAIRGSGLPAVIALNKVDLLDRARTMAALSAVAALGVPGELFPLSARTGDGVQELVEEIVRLLPEGEFLYPADERTDQPGLVHMAELVREQVLLRTRQELPHAVEVEVTETEENEKGLLVIHANVFAESDSQKGILIGSGGAMVRAIGTAARASIEAELERKVHLDLSVQVRKAWRRDDVMLDRLGID